MDPELPLYQCHKKVRALKIKEISDPTGPENESNGSIVIHPEEQGFGPITVQGKFVPRHEAARPQIGWYWVRYEDGYESFSPAEPFEGGYTRI